MKLDRSFNECPQMSPQFVKKKKIFFSLFTSTKLLQQDKQCHKKFTFVLPSFWAFSSYFLKKNSRWKHT